jgi:hypothetical protein
MILRERGAFEKKMVGRRSERANRWEFSLISEQNGEEESFRKTRRVGKGELRTRIRRRTR